MDSTTATTPVATEQKFVRGLRLARLDHARRRVDDRLGNFHRLINHCAAGGRARLVACGLDCDRCADVNGRAFLRRARGDDAESRRAICLLARSVLAALGFSLRLDACSS